MTRPCFFTGQSDGAPRTIDVISMSCDSLTTSPTVTMQWIQLTCTVARLLMILGPMEDSVILQRLKKFMLCVSKPIKFLVRRTSTIKRIFLLKTNGTIRLRKCNLAIRILWEAKITSLMLFSIFSHNRLESSKPLKSQPGYPIFV